MKQEVRSHNYSDAKKLAKAKELAKSTSQLEHVLDRFKLRLILGYKSKEF